MPKKTPVKPIKKETKKIVKKEVVKKEKNIPVKKEDKEIKVTKKVKSAPTENTVEKMKPIAMPEPQGVLLTKEGLKKIQEERTYLETVKRAEIAKKLQSAVSLGDLSENAEYDEAKNEQAFVEMRIVELQQIIEKAQIISSTHGNTNVVELGSTVKIHNITYDRDEKYTIVGSTEADPLKGLISNESPVGRALLGCEVGDNIKANAPRGVIEYKVLKVE